MLVLIILFIWLADVKLWVATWLFIQTSKPSGNNTYVFWDVTNGLLNVEIHF